MSRRDFSGSVFGSGPYSEEEDADPRVGLVNLADVMLVFACGLMLALVSHWGVNLSAVEAASTQDMQEIDNVEEMIGQMQSGSGAYDERGKVYQDPNTGTLYLLENADSDSSETASGGGTTSAEAEKQDGK